ncbi:MAG: prolipoprotein diacylglyceryl transferase [Anaerolineales bacterium]|nr:prolipoprotein diacylglyceryl transferase [Anaerolineales bacterium]
MLPILNLGPLALQAPLLVLLAGIWAGISLSEKEARKAGLSEKNIGNLIFITLGSFLVGARLIFVLQNLDRYLDAPLGIILPNPDTLALLEGSVVGLVTAVVYVQRKNLRLWETLDVLAPGLVVLFASLAGMNLASGDAYGTKSSLPWAIQLWGSRRHPVQGYELLLDGLILAVLLRRSIPEKPGVRFLFTVTLLASGRFFLEGFRANSLVIGGGWRVAQLVLLLMVLGSLKMLRRRLFTP